MRIRDFGLWIWDLGFRIADFSPTLKPELTPTPVRGSRISGTGIYVLCKCPSELFKSFYKKSLTIYLGNHVQYDRVASKLSINGRLGIGARKSIIDPSWRRIIYLG